MAVGVKSWSTTASSNASADSNVNYSEGQLAPTLNNSARAAMAAIAALYDQIGGGATMGGSSNAYTITNASTGTWSAYATGDPIMLIANHTNSGAATLNVDALGTKAITKNGTTALASGDIQSGGAYFLVYDGTRFVMVGEVSSGVYQPLDATLTALAAGTLTGAGKVPYGTGTDTVSEADSQSYGRSLWNVSDEAALKTLINAEAGVDFQAYNADTLFADEGDALTAGFTSDSYSGGTVSSGTYTPAPATGQENFQHYTNGGAHTLAPPASVCAVVVEILNNGSAGVITTSGFTKVTGDSFTTTNGHKFMAHITKTNSYSHLHVTALQ